MSTRKNTTNRLNLIRECGACGRTFSTTADTPWLRQLVVDGRQRNTYFCSQTCFDSSYKHKFDGKAEERRKEREANRDISAKNRLYYQRHIEEARARSRRRYWADPERARADNQYQRRKRKLLEDCV